MEPISANAFWDFSQADNFVGCVVHEAGKPPAACMDCCSLSYRNRRSTLGLFIFITLH